MQPSSAGGGSGGGGSGGSGVEGGAGGTPTGGVAQDPGGGPAHRGERPAGGFSSTTSGGSSTSGPGSDPTQEGKKPPLSAAEAERLERVAALKSTAAQSLPPEEVTIAGHNACVNTIVLVGRAYELNVGYIYETRVFQFSVLCPFAEAPAGESDRDSVVVRVRLRNEDGPGGKRDENAEAWERALTSGLEEGGTVCVVGQLSMNPQMENVNSRYYYYPLVHVTNSCGSVTLL